MYKPLANQGSEERRDEELLQLHAGQNWAAKADAWLDDSIRDGRKKVSVLYAEWLEDLSLTSGTSYLEQCTKYGAYYLLPVIGNLRIEELTEGDLQKCINLSFKKRCLRKDYKPRQTSH